MKKLLLICGFLWSAVASAQFVPGQVLSAAQLNSQFALYAKLSGAGFAGPITGTTATFSGLVSVPALTATGTVSLPSASLPLSYLATQASNTLVANVAGGTASPTAISVPSCSTSSSALQWATNTGLGCNTALNATTLGGVTFAAPSPLGSTTPSTGAFTSLTANNTAANATALTVANTSSNGAIIGMTGNGATTPSKFFRVLGGTLAVVNSAFTNNILTLSDTGGLSVANIDGAVIGNTAAASGAFTSLSASGNDALFYQNSSGQSIPNATNTTVTTWTKVSDRVNTNFNASTGTFTAPVTGQYQVSCQLFYASALNVAATAVQALIVANGVTVAVGTDSITGAATIGVAAQVSAIVSLTAGQTVVIQAFQNSGAARALSATGNFSYLSINRLP